MTFTFEVSNGLYALTKDVESTYDAESLKRAGKIVLQGLSEYSVYYLKDFDIPQIAHHTKSNQRLSVNLAKRSPQLKKAARRSQILTSSF